MSNAKVGYPVKVEEGRKKLLNFQLTPEGAKHESRVCLSPCSGKAVWVLSGDCQDSPKSQGSKSQDSSLSSLEQNTSPSSQHSPSMCNPIICWI